MVTLIWLMWGATFITVASLIYGVFLFSFHRRLLRERCQGTEGQTLPAHRPQQGDRSLKQRLLNWLSVFGSLALKDPATLSRLRLTLIQSGFRQANAPALFFGLRALAAVGLPVAYLLLPILQGGVGPIHLLIALALVAAGYHLPNYLLQVRLRRRQDRLDKALPDILDLMIVSMEAGLALQATINRVAEEIRPVCRDLYSELQITNAELRTGLPRETALKNLGERTGVQSIKSLITLMIQSDKMGASISQALRTHAEFMRVQRAQKAEEMAAKLPVKILFPLMLFILPALFVVILGPAIIQIVKTFSTTMVPG